MSAGRAKIEPRAEGPRAAHGQREARAERLLTLLFLFGSLAFGCAHPEHFRQPPTVDLDDRALNIWQAIRLADPAQMGRDFDPRVDQAFNKAARGAFLDGLRQKFGKPLDISLPATRKKFAAVYTLRFEKGDLEMRLAASDSFAIIGLTIGPPKTEPARRNKVPLALPLEGLALVRWGDDGPGANPRATGEMQRFAYDFIALDPNGRARKGAGRDNADYACFGRKVRAPAAGTVIEAVDGARDNRPGEANPLVALGNAVMIQHGPGEVSVLAHLERGSIRVRAGEKVARGQAIGQCGNSGDSSEPHLHFHLQDQAALQKGNGIRAYFERVKRYGHVALADDSPEAVPIAAAEALVDYPPLRGDVVADAGGAPSRRAAGWPTGASSGGAAPSGGGAAPSGRAMGK
jgi:hypothetical protein